MKRSAPSGRITKDFSFDIKTVTDAGVIEGYASVFGNVDSQGDVIAPGAFSRTLSAWKAKGAKGLRIPVLWQHDAFTPIGVTEAITEDEHGLRVKAKLVMDVQLAKEAFALAREGALGGLSIGFSVPALASDGQSAIAYDEERNARVFREVRLWEYSLVTFPANEEATIQSVKADWQVELLATMRDIRALVAAGNAAHTMTVRPSSMDMTAVPSVGATTTAGIALADALAQAREMLKEFDSHTNEGEGE
jgi:HK97 family phage prohead protease